MEEILQDMDNILDVENLNNYDNYENTEGLDVFEAHELRHTQFSRIPKELLEHIIQYDQLEISLEVPSERNGYQEGLVDVGRYTLRNGELVLDDGQENTSEFLRTWGPTGPFWAGDGSRDVVLRYLDRIQIVIPFRTSWSSRRGRYTNMRDLLIDIKILKKYFRENEAPGATRRNFCIEVSNEKWGFYNDEYHFGTRFQTTHVHWVECIFNMLEYHIASWKGNQ